MVSSALSQTRPIVEIRELRETLYVRRERRAHVILYGANT